MVSVAFRSAVIFPAENLKEKKLIQKIEGEILPSLTNFEGQSEIQENATKV